MSDQLEGFDPDRYIMLSDAFSLVSNMHESARPLTVRKFLIGIALHGNQSGVCGYANRFKESYVRLDSEVTAPYRSKQEKGEAIPIDFWRIGMALDHEAAASFAANNLGHISELTASELPYRMRDTGDGGLQNERVQLIQLANDVHFFRAPLEALASDPQWQAWGDVAQALENRRKHGRPAEWKWDQVKVALTIEAARYPSIIDAGPGPIVQFINTEMAQLHYGGVPDQKDVYAYARLFSEVIGEPQEPPPS